ncbi:MAG: dicarboxylate/amino acid:cation symporter, partial [Acidobacteria bacterium]|nr:dicarboxylate/amino acid:cation symporter [Acidobacteriota bacterium]
MRLPLHTKMILGVTTGAVSGVVAFMTAGDSPALASFIKYVTQPAGQIFLRLLFMLVVP